MIEAVLGADHLLNLLQDWLLMQDLNLESILKVQAFFGLTYQQLGQVFNQGPREIAQAIRAQRLLGLSSYPPVEKALDNEEISGLSCFMVEQQLSAWIDSEVQDMRVVQQLHGHFTNCTGCSQRLQEFRDHKHRTLKMRQSFPPVSEWEWNDSLAEMQRVRKRFWRSFAVYSLFAIVLVGVIVTFLWVRPADVPNVYEVP